MYPTPPDSPDGPSDTEGARRARAVGGRGWWRGAAGPGIKRESKKVKGRRGAEEAGPGESVDELGPAPESLLSALLGSVAERSGFICFSALCGPPQSVPESEIRLVEDSWVQITQKCCNALTLATSFFIYIYTQYTSFFWFFFSDVCGSRYVQ